MNAIRGVSSAPRLLACLVAAVTAAVCGLSAAAPEAAGGPATPPPEPVDLHDMVRRDLGALPETGYTAPDEAARTALRTGLDRVIARDWQGAGDALTAHDYGGTVQQDVPSGVYFERVFPFEHPNAGWGSAYVMGDAASVALLVPHPGCEPGVEHLGVDVARAVPDSILLLAGAKRYAGGPTSGCATPDPKPTADSFRTLGRAPGRLPEHSTGPRPGHADPRRTGCPAPADVSTCAETVFHAWSEYLRGRSMPGLRLTGLPTMVSVADVEVDVPEGAPRSFAESVAARVENAGFTVCRSWVDTCPGVEEGARSRQARAYGAAGEAFASAQVRQSVLDDAAEQASVAAALAAGAAAWERPTPPAS